jgi:hypothetical protein
MKGRRSDNGQPTTEEKTMLVRFESSVTGELLMFAGVAGDLLRAAGKDTTAQGAFTRDEMLAAAVLLRKAVEKGEKNPPPEVDGADEKPVTLGSRAWPFIDMLERTARGGERANIVWKAAADF